MIPFSFTLNCNFANIAQKPENVDETLTSEVGYRKYTRLCPIGITANKYFSRKTFTFEMGHKELHKRQNLFLLYYTTLHNFDYKEEAT